MKRHCLRAIELAFLLAMMRVAPLEASLKYASENYLVPCIPERGKPVLILYDGFLNLFGENRKDVLEYFMSEQSHYAAIRNYDESAIWEFDLYIDGGGSVSSLIEMIQKGDSGEAVAFIGAYEDDGGREKGEERKNIPLKVSRLRPGNRGPSVSEQLDATDFDDGDWGEYFLLNGGTEDPLDRYCDPSVRRCWLVSWDDLRKRWNALLKGEKGDEIRKQIKIISESGRFDLEGGDAWQRRIDEFWNANSGELFPKVIFDNVEGLEGEISVLIDNEERHYDIEVPEGEEQYLFRIPFGNPRQTAQVSGKFWINGDRNSKHFAGVSQPIGRMKISALGEDQSARLDKGGLVSKRNKRENELKDEKRRRELEEKAKLARAEVDESLEARGRGDWQAVKAKADSALKSEPANAKARELKNEAEKKLAEIKEARDNAGRALAEAYEARRSGDWQAVKAKAEEVLRWAPSSSEAANLKDEAEAELKKIEEVREKEESERREWKNFCDEIIAMPPRDRDKARNLLKVTYESRMEWRKGIEELVKQSRHLWPAVTIVNQSSAAVGLSGAIESGMVADLARVSVPIDISNPPSGRVFAAVYGLEADRDEYINNAIDIDWPSGWLDGDVVVNLDKNRVALKPDPVISIQSEVEIEQVRIVYQDGVASSKSSRAREFSIDVIPHRAIARMEISFTDYETKSESLSESLFKRGETASMRIAKGILMPKAKPAPEIAVSSEVPMESIVVVYKNGTSDTVPFVIPMKDANLKLKPDMVVDHIEVKFSGGYSPYSHRPASAYKAGEKAELKIPLSRLQQAYRQIPESDKEELRKAFRRDLNSASTAGGKKKAEKRIRERMEDELMARLTKEQNGDITKALNALGLDSGEVQKVLRIVGEDN